MVLAHPIRFGLASVGTKNGIVNVRPRSMGSKNSTVTRSTNIYAYAATSNLETMCDCTDYIIVS